MRSNLRTADIMPEYTTRSKQCQHPITLQAPIATKFIRNANNVQERIEKLLCALFQIYLRYLLAMGISKSHVFMKKKLLAQQLENCIDRDELALLPRSWYIIGDAIIVRWKSGVTVWKLIGEALLTIYPRARYVLLDYGIYGNFREPKRELIAPRCAITSFETIHRENGCLFKLDPMRIMFSAGNLHERQLLNGICDDEVVIDMFAGIGYFTVPIAVHSKPKKILAIELNAQSYQYLKQNIKLNRIEPRVVALHGDCSKLTPTNMADRVIMGYLSSEEYLLSGITALTSGGTLHYHEAVPEVLYPQRPIKRIKRAALKSGCEIKSIGCRRVKKYSPGVLHSCFDVTIK
ncbi:MAG: tRNA wybutosine-synthesizing protein 2 [Candidatus Argoarchaeum ethanivorans]|uniref:tRNA(Phe) (4-demethylwyosine(37)-C(7)) aminocarboxypropyltransferase n=1 Tax=Candidatus Argoarchaeum ethanivorans TaxID=2608793 RepID=A0A8B3S1H4_9EURY|nr:MAG: tRNA wybutosine-synthesizing protein 2 [Candidatus Argoarchaeum ethanivorans]